MWIGLILVFLVFSPIRSAQANEIRMTEFPIVNLLSRLGYAQEGENPADTPMTLEFVVENDTQKDVFWHFRSEVLDPLAFDFYAGEDDTPIFGSPFRAREQKSHASQGPVLNSGLIAMSPGERLRIRAVFEKPPGAGLFPISILTKDMFDAQNQRRGLAHGMFFGAAVIFVVLFLLSPNFLMNAASNWFGLYLASIALLNMHSHGYSIDFFEISPNAYFPLTRLLHTFVMLFYLLFILSFLKAREAYPVFWRCVWAFIILGTTIAALEQLLASGSFQAVANLVPLTFLIFGSLGAYLAVRDGLHGSRFLMAGFGVLVFAGVINFLASLPRFAQWNEPIDQVTLLLQTADALIFGVALLSQIYGLRHARDQAVGAQLAETQRRLDISNKLLSTKVDLNKARDLAERHRTSLASTSHDLRQPIASLRNSLEIAKSRSPGLVSELSAGVEFLDRLLEQTLTQVRMEAPVHGATEAVDTKEAVELQVILLNAQRMFASEAAPKGIDLRIVDSSLVVSISPIDLIRMVSNLTANAVRYSASGAVLIGVRRRHGYAAIEVWDTGQGIPPEQLDAVQQRYTRGAGSGSSPGEGLGLSIVKELAEQNGLTLKVRSVPERGSVFSIEGLVIVHDVPAAMTSQ